MDASVLAKWFVPEQGHEQARELMRRCETGELRVEPDLAYVETSNALLHAHRRGDITQPEMVAAVHELTSMDVQTASSADVVEEAMALAEACSLSVWDCVYVVVAKREGAELWTADEELHRRARRDTACVNLLVW